MKYCEEYAALLDSFVDGELSLDESEQIRSHLVQCPGCRAYVQDALLIRELFPDDTDVEVPDGFAEGVMAAIRADAAPQKKRKAPWSKVLLPLAACCAVVLLVRSTLPFSGSSNTSSASMAMDTAEAADTGDTMGRAVFKEEASMESEADDASDSPSAAADLAPGSPALFAATGTSEETDGDTAAEQPDSEQAPTPYASFPADGETAASADDSANAAVKNESGTSNEASPHIQDTPSVSPAASDYFAELFLTKEQAGTLLDAYAKTSVASNSDTGLMETTYELTRPQFESLLSALDTNISYTENGSGDLAKVVVTDSAT